jgi:hypothetical protein
VVCCCAPLRCVWVCARVQRSAAVSAALEAGDLPDRIDDDDDDDDDENDYGGGFNQLKPIPSATPVITAQQHELLNGRHLCISDLHGSTVSCLVHVQHSLSSCVCLALTSAQLAVLFVGVAAFLDLDTEVDDVFAFVAKLP